MNCFCAFPLRESFLCFLSFSKERKWGAPWRGASAPNKCVWLQPPLAVGVQTLCLPCRGGVPQRQASILPPPWREAECYNPDACCAVLVIGGFSFPWCEGGVFIPYSAARVASDANIPAAKNCVTCDPCGTARSSRVCFFICFARPPLIPQGENPKMFLTAENFYKNIWGRQKSHPAMKPSGCVGYSYCCVLMYSSNCPRMACRRLLTALWVL